MIRLCNLRWSALVLGGLICFSPSLAHASGPQPGDLCTAGEADRVSQVGGPDNSGSGHLVVCDGTNWKPILEWQNASGRVSIQVSQDTDPCTAEKTGRQSYDAVADEWTYCNGSNWLPFEHAGGGGGGAVCNIFGQTPGYVCPDGTVFAGFPPNTFHPLFVTRCDAGQEWDGAACTGTHASLPWGSSGISRGFTSNTDGAANTTALAAFGEAAHPAAYYCENLELHGHSDWYLPAAAEIHIMRVHRDAIMNFSTSLLWSSRETAASTARHQSFSGLDHNQNYPGKDGNLRFRCARKN